MRILIFNPLATSASNEQSIRIVTTITPLLHSAETKAFDAVIIPYSEDSTMIANQLRAVCDSAILLLINESDFEQGKKLLESFVIDGVVYTHDFTKETEAIALSSLESGRRAEKINELEKEIEKLEIKATSYLLGNVKTTRFIINKASRIIGGISTISTILYHLIKALWS